MKESSKVLFGAFLGIVLAIVTVSGLGYPGENQLFGLFGGIAREAAPSQGQLSPATTAPPYATTDSARSDASIKVAAETATLQTVAQAGFSGNLILILSFVIALALATIAYLVFRKR